MLLKVEFFFLYFILNCFVWWFRTEQLWSSTSQVTWQVSWHLPACIEQAHSHSHCSVCTFTHGAWFGHAPSLSPLAHWLCFTKAGAPVVLCTSPDRGGTRSRKVLGGAWEGGRLLHTEYFLSSCIECIKKITLLSLQPLWRVPSPPWMATNYQIIYFQPTTKFLTVLACLVPHSLWKNK